MTRQEVLRKLDAILAKAEQERMFGSIEITIRGGRATVISRTETDRLDGEMTQNGRNAAEPSDGSKTR